MIDRFEDILMDISLQAFNNKHYPYHEAFSLINDPRNEYGKLYTVDKLGNVWNGLPIRCKPAPF